MKLTHLKSALFFTVTVLGAGLLAPSASYGINVNAYLRPSMNGAMNQWTTYDRSKANSVPQNLPDLNAELGHALVGENATNGLIYVLLPGKMDIHAHSVKLQ